MAMLGAILLMDYACSLHVRLLTSDGTFFSIVWTSRVWIFRVSHWDRASAMRRGYEASDLGGAQRAWREGTQGLMYGTASRFLHYLVCFSPSNLCFTSSKTPHPASETHTLGGCCIYCKRYRQKPFYFVHTQFLEQCSVDQSGSWWMVFFKYLSDLGNCWRW